MSHVDEAVLDLTISEASLLADVLGVAPPPGLVDPDDDVTDLGAGVAPGLVERRILDGEGTVAAPVADLLTVVGSPHLVARVVHEVGGRSEIRSFAVRPEMAVEQRGLTNGLVRFTPFHPGELIDRIMSFVADSTDDLDTGAEDDTSAGGGWAGGGRESAAVESTWFECPAAALDQIFAVDGHGQRRPTAAQVDILVGGGVDQTIAASFVAAANNLRSTNSVTVLHRPSEQQIVGVDLTWLDGGRHGLWLNEPSESGLSVRRIEYATLDRLSSNLADFLPFDRV